MSGAPLPRGTVTFLFSDIEASTDLVRRVGDDVFAAIRGDHRRLLRDAFAERGGREIDTAGDGFFASFDGPARAVQAATTITGALGEAGIPIRAGVHTGECEVSEDKLAGIAVSIAARIASVATSGEVLVSSTVKDLVAGSGIAFEDRGEHVLKGVPDSWRLYAAGPL